MIIVINCQNYGLNTSMLCFDLSFLPVHVYLHVYTSPSTMKINKSQHKQRLLCYNKMMEIQIFSSGNLSLENFALIVLYFINKIKFLYIYNLCIMQYIIYNLNINISFIINLQWSITLPCMCI